MSTRKSTMAIEAKGESIATTKEKDNTTNDISANDGINKTATTNPAKTELDTQTQKMGNNISGNNRVTRNSPLLLSPTIKKESHGADSEPTNSESEDNCSNASATKKPIRGRKSIKDNKEAVSKETTAKKVIKEDSSTNVIEDMKEKNQEISKDTKENEETIDEKTKENLEKDCKAYSDDQKEIKENIETKECKEKDTKDLKEIKDTKIIISKETKDEDSKEITAVIDNSKETTDDKKCEESKAIVDAKDSKDANDLKDAKESKSSKEVKVSKESKDAKESKETKGSKDAKDTLKPTNRLTRNAVAQDVASKTRMTRNRQASASSISRLGTVRGRRNSNLRKPAETSVSQKRKRSVEDHNETPVSKIIKLEPKDADEETESLEQIVVANVNIESIKIKQEFIESDDASSTTAESSTAITNTTTSPLTITTGRGRSNRWTGRKPKQTASPTTRSTRQNKNASPAPPAIIATTTSNATEPKRRRTNGGNTIRRNSSSNTLKTATQTTSNNNTAPDEDSKDSTTSLIDGILLAADIKMETLTPELDDNNDIDMECKKSTEEDEKLEEAILQITNGIVEPLTIETEVANTAVEFVEEETKNEISENEPTTSSVNNIISKTTNKDVSLSPELVSEGVSEISVKQFYKRPEFLENNRGIEEDPKLGEIVQKVTVEFDGSEISKTASENDNEIVDDNDETETATATDIDIVDVALTTANNNVDAATTSITDDATTISNSDENTVLNESFSAESLKEGELVYEDDDAKTISNDIDGDGDGDGDAESSFVNVSSIADDATSSADDRLIVEAKINKCEEIDSKIEDESLQERLLLEQEDGEDDEDMTAEESETISMDNNPSLQDDEDQDSVSNQANTIFEIDDLAQDGGLIDEILNGETKKPTINKCGGGDIVKIKAQAKNLMDEEIKLKESSAEKDAKAEAEEEKEKEHVENLKSCENIEIEQKISEAPKLLEKEKTTEVNIEKQKVVVNVDKSVSAITKETTDELKDLKVENELSPSADKKEFEENVKSDELEKLPEIEISTEEPKLLNQLEPMEVNDEPKDEPEKMDTDEEKEQTASPRPTTPKQESQNINETSSAIFSPSKSTNEKDEDATSTKSAQSTGSWVTIEQENDDEERLRQKEQHLQNLGLLTHKAAEKKRQEFIQTAAAVEASRAAAPIPHHSKRNGGRSSSSNTTTPHEYTGTLKTVIKLNRNSSGGSTGTTATLTSTTASTSNGSSVSRKSQSNSAKESGVRRQSLKITFQKGRGRATHHGNERNSGNNNHGTDNNAHGEDSYYTIQNENEGAQKNSSGSSLATVTAGTKDQQLRIQKQQNNNNNINNYNHYNNNTNINNNNTPNIQTHGRKSYNSRSNTTTYSYNCNHHFSKNSTHFDSSHSEGQNDAHNQHHHHSSSAATTSHKKDDREEILIPEKASSFKFHPGRLCEDQCYYCSGKFGLYDTPCHVGQIKSLERQSKILKNEEKLTVDNCLCDACFRHVDRRANVPSYKKRLLASGNLDDGHTDGDGAGDDTAVDSIRKCFVPDCMQNSAHSLRRKCIRKSVKKYLLNFDMPTGGPFIWLCQNHYDAVIQCSGCVLCKRRLGKNHMYHITSDTERLEKSLTDMGIPVQLGIGTAVCKLCRYFANLLMKPPDSTKSQKAEFVKNYRKRLLQFHNIHDGSNEASDVDEDENATTSKAGKNEGLNKEQRKVSSPGASSNSSLICVNDNALDTTNGSNAHEQSNADNDTLENFVEGETSNDHSKSTSASPSGSKQDSRLKAILQSGGKSKKGNDLPSALLRSNPNLSMRELFPGEEDLGLHFKAPFGSSNSQRTPEGWTRVQTFLQYDEPTRRLWEELQKPYGNQSSFLRHLILLEKYYRNGDLVLSPNASSNASVYTRTVRQRLNSYDQGHCGGLAVSSATVTPNAAPSSSSAAKEKPKASIPLVEINDDDEDVVETKKKTHKDDDDDDDVIMTEVQQPPSAEKSSTSRRRKRSVSVDKLTQQLSTNAVTIIAKPKDTQQTPNQFVTSIGKSNVEVSTQKRNDSTKLQTSPIVSKTQSQGGGGSGSNNNSAASIAALAPLSSVASSAVAITAIPGSIASSNASAGNSRSILKSNLLGMTSNKSIELLPIAPQKSSNVVTATTVTVPTAAPIDNNQSNSTHAATTIGGSSKQQKILEVANKLLGSQLEAAAAAAAAKTQQHNNNLLTSPPELVSLHRRSSGNNMLPPTSSGSNINLSTSTPSSSSSASSTTASLISAKRPHLMPNRQVLKPPPPSHNVVLLPDTLSPHERAESKSWRPTLMSVEENQHMLNKHGPLYQTADGRRLPGLVQVQSGGKPFLISIFDYNRMCILRREKLLRDQMLKAGKHNKSQHHHQQQRATSGQHSSNFNKMNTSGGNSSNNNNNNNNSGSGNNNPPPNNKQAQAAQAQQQLLQLMQFHNRQQAVLKGPNNGGGGSGGGANNRYTNLPQKPTLIPTTSAMMTGVGVSVGNTQTVNSRPINTNQASNFPMPLLANALTNAATAAAAANPNINTSLNNNPWLWSNFPDAHELLRNGAGAGGGGSNKLPPLMPKPTTSASATITSKQMQQQQQQLLMDNNLMSKIPKSLTVIPQSHMQHKLMGGSNNNTSAGSKE